MRHEQLFWDKHRVQGLQNVGSKILMLPLSKALENFPNERSIFHYPLVKYIPSDRSMEA